MKRLRYGLLAGLLLCTELGMAAPPQWAYRISFNDKAGAAPLSSSASFLSARALLRRSQQGIAVSEDDRPVSPDYIDSVTRISGGKLHNTSRWFNQCVILATDTINISVIRSRPFVSGVTLVGYFANGLHKGGPAPGKDVVPGGGTANRGTGTAAYYGSTWSQTSMVNGDYLHDNNLRGDGQLIAVLDLGFLGVPTHVGFDSMRTQGRLADTYNFVSASTDIYTAPWSHGTASLSTMAGLAPGTFVGSAPHANYALYVTDDNNYNDAVYELDNFVAGLERADSLGADIVTASLGYNTFDNPAAGSYDFSRADLDGHTTLIARAMNRAVAKGIFAVNSAGNEGGNNWNFLLSAGDADSAMTVGAVVANRTIAGFSSPGPNSSGRVKPDVCLQGDPAAIFTVNSYGTSSGTSFSAPQLAGWAACLRQLRPDIKPAELRMAIIRSADRASNPDAPGGYGYGIPDFRKALQYVGVHELPGQGAWLSLAPNPFSDRIVLRLAGNKALTVKAALYDMSGKCVLRSDLAAQGGGSEFTIAVPAQLPAGNYLFQADCAGKLITQKITKL